MTQEIRNLGFEGRYIAELDRQIATLETNILGGAPRTFDEYKYTVGQYRALVICRNHYIELLNEQIKKDE